MWIEEAAQDLRVRITQQSLNFDLRRCDAVERVVAVGDVGVEIRPELDKEKGFGGALLVQLLQAALLLRKLVLDLAHVDRL